MENDDRRFMQMAVELAARGQGRTSPNPCVGAVIVRDGAVVGQGYHERAGTPHAEIHAIADAGEACAGATIYVTLEPCNHTGRTPPCSRAVLAAGLHKVVIGMADPNPVAQGGADFLRSQGLEVVSGILEEQCRRLNYPFIKHSVTGLPWIVMKAGMSLDGKISRRQGAGGAITGPESKKKVHVLRDRYDAILIGIGTALIDDPSLTTRLPERGRDPLRIVLDSDLRLRADAKMLVQQSSAPTWVFCNNQARQQRQQRLEAAGAVVHRMKADPQGRLDLFQVMQEIGKAGISSILVEGGAGVHGSFVRAGLVDQVYLFIAPYFIGDQGTPLLKGFSLGEDASAHLADRTTELVGQDILLQGLLKLPL
jgi:diaminohydroxyphosphoribosylaminopyrimidine deaminase/5-amino-6-(5-phosphoribosylamino)uracil reductase